MLTDAPSAPLPRSQRDRFTWIAVYTDGTALHEYDDATPDGHGWAEVDQQRLFAFVLEDRQSGAQHFLHLTKPESQRVFFRRRQYRVDMATDEGTDLPTKTVMGVQYLDAAGVVTHEVLVVYFDNGDTIVTDDRERF